jgi:hypothetical protein
MCYYITIGLPENSELNPKDHLQFLVDSQQNTSIRIAFGSEFKLFYISEGYCGCSLYNKPHQSEEELKLRSQYEKKGWSEAKISRAIACKLSNTQRGLRSDLRQQLVKLVSELKSLLLLVHHYAGDIDEETITIHEKKEISVSDLLNNKAIIPEDIVIWIKGS